MTTKTSKQIRNAVDTFLELKFLDTSRSHTSHYLCDVLTEGFVLEKEEIKEMFIYPELEKKGREVFQGLFETNNRWELSKKKFEKQQAIRFLFAEFIACYYEGIGD